MARLPTIGGDNGNWGTVLNQFLDVSHNSDGTIQRNALQTSYGISAAPTASGDATGATDYTNLTTWVATLTSNNLQGIIPPGTYYINQTLNWTADNLIIRGSGKQSTIISQVTTNTAIVTVGGQNQHIEGMQLTYKNGQEPSTSTSSDCLQFNKTAFMCVYKELLLTLGSTGINVLTSGFIGSGIAIFNCHLDTVEIDGFSIGAIAHIATNENSTGNVWDNIYVHNNYNGTAQSSTQAPVRIKNSDGDCWNQLNIEHLNITTGQDALILNVARTQINSLHFEAVTLPSSGKSGFIRLFGSSGADLHSEIIVGMLELKNNTLPNGVTPSIFRIAYGNVICMGARTSTNTINSAAFYKVDYDASALGYVEISGFLTNDQTTADVNNEPTPTATRRVNDIWYSGPNAPMSVFTANGTYTVPSGVTMVDIYIKGGGGSGGGGGAAATSGTSVGGGGGGDGQLILAKGVAVSAGQALTVTVSAAQATVGSGASANAAGATGGFGTQGHPSSVTGSSPSVSLTAVGGGGGGPGSNGAATATAGEYGVNGQTSGSKQPGEGGIGTSSGGTGSGAGGSMGGGGGGGGGPATTSLGGTGGIGGLAYTPGTGGSQGGSGTVNGTVGGNADANSGSGGGGGGGGAPTGNGASGGQGGGGLVTIKPVG